MTNYICSGFWLVLSCKWSPRAEKGTGRGFINWGETCPACLGTAAARARCSVRRLRGFRSQTCSSGLELRAGHADHKTVCVDREGPLSKAGLAVKVTVCLCLALRKSERAREWENKRESEREREKREICIHMLGINNRIILGSDISPRFSCLFADQSKVITAFHYQLHPFYAYDRQKTINAFY